MTTDPTNLPSTPPALRQPRGATGNEDTPGPTPRTPTSSDPWTPAAGVGIPMVPRQAASTPPAPPNLPTPQRKGGAPAPLPVPGPRPVPARPPVKR